MGHVIAVGAILGLRVRTAIYYCAMQRTLASLPLLCCPVFTLDIIFFVAGYWQDLVACQPSFFILELCIVITSSAQLRRYTVEATMGHNV